MVRVLLIRRGDRMSVECDAGDDPVNLIYAARDAVFPILTIATNYHKATFFGGYSLQRA